MCANDLPEAITCPKTPRDQNGDLIASGRWYRVFVGRGKPCRVLVEEDPEVDELLCKPKGGERGQLVNQMDPSATWELIGDDEL